MKMNELSRTFWPMVLGLVVCSCQSESKQSQSDPQVTQQLKIEVQQEETYQTIAHFGASDAWSCQFVGLWPDHKKTAMAELLFSREKDGQGSPKGIGLSLWRFNIGAGSAEQGEESGIRDEWRRAESFLSADGSYDWSRQAGQVWFAQAAQEFGVPKLLVFPNSPPVHMTKNGKAYATEGKPNLQEGRFDEFGDYLANVIGGLEQKGLTVDYVSPVNEPQWDWSDGGQEGTPFFNADIAGIVRNLDASLTAAGLSTKIDVAEAGKINYLYEKADKPDRGSQVEAFFRKGSRSFIGELPHVGHAISGHSYFTTSPFTSAVQQRENLQKAIAGVEGLEFWMSEYCILGDNGGEINGSGKDLGIDPALYMARVIHNDLTVANASAWHWWLAISPYDYKDGLIYIDYHKQDGGFEASKMLWALGNYSHFVRPGYQRKGVVIEGNDSLSANFLAAAFSSPKGNELVYVLINSGIEAVEAELSVDGGAVTAQQAYITSKELDLAPVAVDDETVAVPARSIVTVIVKPLPK
ncbi:xylanase [Echinicola soli]|uniref:Xylanase n=1 Tax=Echinicola soli TaxID=2591634 RepID=A0A514CMZ7_9BACT|nr:glycoside hydrolase [Echinicola soli]QDH81084.1 xylanase [Echinicola soli]